MASEEREKTWSRLRDQAFEALESERIQLRAVTSELEQISNALTQLVEMKGEYQPEQSEIVDRSSFSVDKLRRTWTFVSSLEDAIRKTNQQKIIVKKKERRIRDTCLELEREVKKYEALERRAGQKRLKAEEAKERKVADEVASAFWLRQNTE
mgnify:FL=1